MDNFIKLFILHYITIVIYYNLVLRIRNTFQSCVILNSLGLFLLDAPLAIVPGHALHLGLGHPVRLLPYLAQEFVSGDSCLVSAFPGPGKLVVD